MFTKRSTNLYCIAIICLYTQTIESRETPLLRRRKQNSPFCLAELFHFSPFLFFTKRGKPPGLPLGRFFLSAVLPYQNENVYKTFNKSLLYRYNLPVYSNHQIKRDPALEETQTEFPLLFGRTFSFLPLSFYKSEKAVRTLSDGFFARICGGGGKPYPYKRDAPARKGSRAGATGEKMRYL